MKDYLLLTATPVLILSVDAWLQSKQSLVSKKINRREALGNITSWATGIVAGTELLNPDSSLADDLRTQLSGSSDLPSSFDAYGITPVENYVRSNLEKIDSKEFLGTIASDYGSVWLGEHHSSATDHDFQATLIREVHKKRQKLRQMKNAPMAIGLEQVQIQFQPALDDYIAGKISLEEMRYLVQWDKRWTWPFDVYKKIFELAKDLRIQLLALNVDSEDLELVEKNGYPGLSTKRLHTYIKDPIGFAEFSQGREFSTYVNYVIEPSFELHKRLGLLQRTMTGEEMESEMSFSRFLSGRLLWDEGMASNAFSWCVNNPTGLLIGLVGADHVKFEHGIPGRFMRMAKNKQLNVESTAIVINPTLIDSRPSGSVSHIPTSDSAQYPERVTFQLRCASAETTAALPNSKGVLSFSDYIVVT